MARSRTKIFFVGGERPGDKEGLPVFLPKAKIFLSGYFIIQGISFFDPLPNPPPCRRSRGRRGGEWGRRGAGDSLSAEGSAAMITLQKVQKSYTMGGSGKLLPVLDIQEFVVPEGSRMAVAGPSGSGKTTLFHIIAGILAPTSGRVQVAGTDLTELRGAERDRFRARHTGYVFQSFNLLRAFTALENVMLGMVFAGAMPPTEQHARAVELLERVGLGHRLGHKPTQLSNGEQQRVAVARALANRPRILLADEPSAHLDFETAERVTEVIGELCAEGGVILLVATHDPRLLRTFEHVVQMQTINRVLR